MWTIEFHFLDTHQKHGFWELIKGKRSNRGCGNFVLLFLPSPCFSSPPPLLHHSQTRVRVPTHCLWHCHSSAASFAVKNRVSATIERGLRALAVPQNRSQSLAVVVGQQVQLSRTFLHKPPFRCVVLFLLLFSHSKSSSAPAADQFCLLLRSLD